MKNFILILPLLFSSLSWSQKEECIICFSHPAGFYAEAIDLTLNSSKDSVKIFYTLDGTTPSSSSIRYSEPIHIDTIKALRFIAYQNGKQLANFSNTYFINRPFTMGVISIITDPSNFFSYDRGIYEKGCCAGENPPYNGANFWKDWEREVNIEFFEKNGTLAFNQEAGVKIFGGFSKGLPMKSLSINARNKYGKNRFEYPLFPDKDIKKYKSFILRNSGGDFNKTHFRDALFTNLVAPLDIEIQAYRPVVVYINGEYWGIHNLREKITEHYLKYNRDINKDSVDIMKHRMDLQYGNRKQYQAFLKYLYKTDLSDTLKVNELATFMDIDNYINYNITQIYLDNRDAGGNIRYWKPQNNHSKWRWILFDTDMSFGISDWKGYKTNTLKQMTSNNSEAWPNPAWSTLIIRKLLENDSLKNQYINRFADHLNTIFSSENVLFKIDSIKSLLNEEMPNHVERWKSNNLERWERNVQILRDFATYRPSYLRKFIMEKFELTDTLFVELTPTNKKEGAISLNSLKIKKPFKGYYFKEVPILLTAKPYYGYEFVEWKGIDIKEKTINYNLTKDIKVTPIFKKKAPSKWQQKVVINEICLKSENKDWVELYNNTDTTIDISNWQLAIDKKTIRFKEQTLLTPNQYFVIARQPQNFPNLITLAKDTLPSRLSSKKGFIALLDLDLSIVDSYKYNVKKNFKNDSVSNPIILEKVNPNQLSNVANWNISDQSTIGKRNSAFKILKPFIKNPLQKYFKAIIWGFVGFFVFILIILIIRRIKHLSKIG